MIDDIPKLGVVVRYRAILKNALFIPLVGARVLTNPYRPGVGLQPAYLAGRSQQLREFNRMLRSAPAIPGNGRVTGLRGVGKTVLLKRFQEEAEQAGWATVATEIEPRHSDEVVFFELISRLTSDHQKRMSTASRLREAAADIFNAARQAMTVSYEGVQWSISGDLDAATRSTAEMLLDATRAAVRAGKNGLVLLLDEAQILADEKGTNSSHSLSALLAAVSELQKQAAPICLVLCGLPTLTINLLAARTYSERMFRGFRVEELPTEEARAALVRPLEDTPIKADPVLVERVVSEVDGYPYFIQLWGAELWDATVDAGLTEISVTVLNETEGRIRDRLDLDFYAPRIDSLTPAEQDLLLAAASCSYPPLMVAELNAASSKTNENINVLLGRLVKANILFRPRKGRYQYTAPKFQEFLIRRAAEPPLDDKLW